MFSSSFTLAGLTLHWYGLLIGLGVIISALMSEWRARQVSIELAEIWQKSLLPVLLAGLLGARIWHVITDWQLYTNDWASMLFVWNGGMSIIGGILGGSSAVIWLGYKHGAAIQKILLPTNKSSIHPGSKRYPAYVFSDLIVFGLPLAQAVGRLGNWINQELYGLPTRLPWGIYIQPEFRLAGFEGFDRFHPLFLYESLGLSIIWLSLFITDKRYVSNHLSHDSEASNVRSLGSGILTVRYIVLYGVLRFGLDFLRIDATYWGLLTTSQWVIVIALLLCAGTILLRRYDKT